jgi:hypothetical protein
MLRAYISHIKATFRPVLSNASKEILTAYYQRQRKYFFIFLKKINYF